MSCLNVPQLVAFFFLFKKGTKIFLLLDTDFVSFTGMNNVRLIQAHIYISYTAYLLLLITIVISNTGILCGTNYIRKRQFCNTKLHLVI